MASSAPDDTLRSDASLRASDSLRSDPDDPALEWRLLTGADFARLDRSRCIVMVSCSPLEVHGPHLPTITDNLEAEGLSRRTRQILHARRPGLTFLRMPPIYVAADVLPHFGSVMFRSSTVTRVMEDLGRSLCKQGFRDIWVGNFHGGPRHLVPIEVAADRVNRRYGGRMISLFGMLMSRLTRGDTDLSAVFAKMPGVVVDHLPGDTHGGMIETSMMLHLLGPHVGPYAHLPRRTLTDWVREKGREHVDVDGGGSIVRLMQAFRDKIKYYEDETYAGAPASASPELGARVLDDLSTRMADALEDVLDGRAPPEQWKSPLWSKRWLFTSETIGRAFEALVRYRQRVF